MPESPFPPLTVVSFEPGAAAAVPCSKETWLLEGEPMPSSERSLISEFGTMPKTALDGIQQSVSKSMKNKLKKLLAVTAVVAATAPAARADVITDAIEDVSGFTSSLGGLGAAVIAIGAIFVGIKLAKRAMGKV